MESLEKNSKIIFNGKELSNSGSSVYKTLQLDKTNKYNNSISVDNIPIQYLPISNPILKNRDLSTSIYTKVKNIEKTDKAFINSLLSYAVYEKNEWIIHDRKHSIEEMTEKLFLSLNEPEKTQEVLLNLKFWHFSKDFFEPFTEKDILSTEVGNHDIQLRSSIINKVENGIPLEESYNKNKPVFHESSYSCSEDLAHAMIVKSVHPQGGVILHVAFRGTEFERGVGYLATQYFPKAYLDFNAYYEKNFLALEKMIMEYANNPKNNVKEIQLSGHSLGAPMTREWLKNNPVSKEANAVKISAYTFGSPGSEQRKYMKFLTNVYHFVTSFRKMRLTDNIEHDDRISEFYHTNVKPVAADYLAPTTKNELNKSKDPVPLLGAIAYKRNGDQYSLYDEMYQDGLAVDIEKERGNSFLDKLPIIGKLKNLGYNINKFHDKKKYVINLFNLVNSSFTTYPELKNLLNSNTKYIRSFKLSTDKFIDLIDNYKTDYEKIFSLNKKEDNFTDENKIHNNTINKINEIRERAIHNSESSYLLSQRKRSLSIGKEGLINSIVVTEGKVSDYLKEFPNGQLQNVLLEKYNIIFKPFNYDFNKENITYTKNSNIFDIDIDLELKIKNIRGKHVEVNSNINKNKHNKS